MNLQKSIYRLVVSLVVVMSHVTALQAAEHIVTPKFGAIKRGDNNNHRVDNNNFDFNDNSVFALGVTYLYKLDQGYAFGADVYGYKNKIVTTATNKGDATTAHIYGVFQKYFNTGGTVQPYVGIGLGLASVSFNANVNGAISDGSNDHATGLSYEVILGSEFAINEFIGVVVEYKYFDFKIDDDIDGRNIKIESNGQALLVGASMHF